MAPTNETHGVVLFDGTCVFCRGSVEFIASRDPDNYLKFGASQSDAGQALLARYGLNAVATHSIVLIEKDQVFLKSTASLRIAARLTFPWRLARHLLWVPRPLRDGVYDVVAAVRLRIAGATDVCDIPPAALRNRLL